MAGIGLFALIRDGKNLLLLAHARNTPSHFVLPQQNRRQHHSAGNVSTETWTSKAAESLPCTGAHVTRVSRGQPAGIQGPEFFIVLPLWREKWKEGGEVIIRLTKLTLRVHMVSLQDSQELCWLLENCFVSNKSLRNELTVSFQVCWL